MASNAEVLEELHQDLSRKYSAHVHKIKEIWRSLDAPRREKCLRAGAADGAVLQHSQDRSLGNVYMIAPELNVRDIAQSGPDFLLNQLEHRAMRSLTEQYRAGVDDSLGDHGLIAKMMSEQGLRHVDSFQDCFTLFISDEQYGQSFRIVKKEALDGFQPAIRAQLIVPQSMGELILQRQLFLMQSLNILIEDILEEETANRPKKSRPKKSRTPASKALPRLTNVETPQKLTLPEVIAVSQSQKEACQDYLDLCWEEPVVLAHAVNIWFFTQPEFVPDEKGRVLPCHTDKFISPALFQAVQNVHKSVSAWRYIHHLVQLLESMPNNKTYRALIAQELSNTCHFEFTRAQAILRRHVQMGSGSKWFKRNSRVQDNLGMPRVALKGEIEALFGSDTQLYYVLRLCQPETTWTKAVDWMKKLSDLHRTHPAEHERLREMEVDSLGDFAVILSLMEDLSSVISLPPFSRKTSQTFASESLAVDTRLFPLIADFDVQDLAVPIDNLIKEDMAVNAMNRLDEYLTGKIGTTMEKLFSATVSGALDNLDDQYRQLVTKMEQDKTGVPAFLPSAAITQDPISRERRQKIKTRSGEPSSDGISLLIPPPSEAGDLRAKRFEVSPATAQVFKTLFDKTQSRSPVNWEAFEQAMAEIGFSVMPKFGSVFCFQPSDKMGMNKSFTVHRPHKSKIEGYTALILAKRLKRVYGWTNETFRTA